jgi:hypothetical protein
MVRAAAISVRVESGVKAAVEKAAAADRRTVASFVEKILIEHLEEHGYLKKPRKS